MARQWYSRRHYQALSNGGPDTPEIIRERYIAREAGQRANSDAQAKYNPLTVENAQAFSDYQTERMRHHETGLRASDFARVQPKARRA